MFKQLGSYSCITVVVAIVFVCFKAMGYIERMKMRLVNAEEAKKYTERYIDQLLLHRTGDSVINLLL